MPSQPMTSIGAIRAYLYGSGKEAIFTLVSPKTGNRFTYRLRRRSSRDPFFFADLLAGDNNEEDYIFIGTAQRDTRLCAWAFRHSRKSPVDAQSPAVEGLDWFVTLTNYKRDLDPAKIEFWHSGRCSRCGRLLTVPESLENGLGPVCRTKAAKLVTEASR